MASSAIRATIGLGVLSIVAASPLALAPAAKAQSHPIGQGWWYGENADPGADEGSSFIARAAKGYPSRGSGAGLMIVCQSDVKTLGLIIDWDGPIHSDRFVEVALRVDQRAPIALTSWHADRSTSSIFDEDAHEIVKEMQRGTRVMHARITDRDGDARTLAFDLMGFEEALLRVLDPCGQ
ncbi:MAG: hypothetical protein ISN28_04760 [Ectothiorhodospiraceae bacterium AqS1]|nr:hypothetical protein [Ectothiorhodospiraceae bacterium AqS1]